VSKKIEAPHPSHDDPLFGELGIEPDWQHVAAVRPKNADEIPTYEVTLPPGCVTDPGSNRAAHWLMAYNRLLDLANEFETVYCLKQFWLPSDYADTGAGWTAINMHNSPHDVGQGPWGGGIGWGFGNGVSAIAWNLDYHTPHKWTQHVEQVTDDANGSKAKEFPLTDWPRGKWVTDLAEIRFGRGDGTTKHTGYIKHWLDAAEVMNQDPITNLQRAQDPSGKWWTQTKGEWWEGGPYILRDSHGGPNVTFKVRMTLSQIGATLEDCYSDRPLLEKQWGATYQAPGWSGPYQSSSSRQLTGADARTVGDLVLPDWAKEELGINGTPPEPTPPDEHDAEQDVRLDDHDARIAKLEAQMSGIANAAG
jgi:hypothetical protein